MDFYLRGVSSVVSRKFSEYQGGVRGDLRGHLQGQKPPVLWLRLRHAEAVPFQKHPVLRQELTEHDTRGATSAHEKDDRRPIGSLNR